MATHLANAKRRSAHAGSLAFFVLVGLADIAASALAYFYGATIGAWLLTCVLGVLISSLAYLHHDMTLIIFFLLSLILLILLALTALFAKKSTGLALGCLLGLGLVGTWTVLHFVFHVQGTSFLPNLDRFTFPLTGPQPFLAHPHLFTGLGWLAVHLLLHLGNDTPACVPPPPTRPQDAVSSNPAQTTFQTSALVESTLAAQEATPPAEEQTVYLNPLSVGEDKWNVLVGCIAHYEERLTRLFPPPISRLKVPPRQRIFYVKEGYQVIWHWDQLVLTESLLDPHNEHRLLTSLARALWDNNTADLSTRLFLSLYPDAPGCLPIPLSLLGIFIWIPSAVKGALNYQDWRADRELARDRFAWMCGAGETLLHQIRQWIDAGLEEPDPHLPRLIERKGQLEALLAREHEQMRAQDLTPTPPLVGRTSPPQLGTARTTHSQEN